MDKRVEANQKVKRKIENALFTLLNRKNFSTITVTDIVQTAGVARASYYRNFRSKEQIIETYMANQRHDIADLITFSESLSDIFNEKS